MRKIAIVTGASTGIGRVTAWELSKQGIYVILIARTKERLEKTKRLIESGGGRAQIELCDLSKVSSVNLFLEKIKSKFKQIDILINIAGIWHGNNEVFAGLDLEKFSQKVILDTFTVGAIAPTLLVHGLLSLMPKKAKIINLSGTFEDGAKGWLPYYVSKKAIEDLTVGLSEELKEKDIQVNCVSPSDTATEEYKKYFLQYISQANQPEDIAEFITHLCQSDNITGKVFVVKKGKAPFESFHH